MDFSTVSAYTRYVDEYHEKVLEINEQIAIVRTMTEFMDSHNCLLDIYEQTKGAGNYDIFDLKEQARNVYTEIERVIAERTIAERYINERCSPRCFTP